MRIKVKQDSGILGLSIPVIKAGQVMEVKPFLVSKNYPPSERFYLTKEGIVIDIQDPGVEVL